MRKGKRFAVMLVVIALAAVMAISMSACGGGEADTGGDATPVKLVLDYTKVKTSYDYDEPFTSNGLVVRVEMSDGTRQEVKTGYKVEKPDMTPGQHMVTVTYGELSARYPVFVSDMIKNYDDSEFAVLNAPGLYVVEAEDIDLGKCEASPIDASAATIQRTSSVFVGKKAYLTNFGAAGNCVALKPSRTSKATSALLIEMVAETKVRAVVERTFYFNKSLTERIEDVSRNDTESYCRLFMSFGLNLMRRFEEYAANGTADFAKDAVSFVSIPVYATPDQLREHMGKIMEILRPAQVRTSEEQELRTIALVSAPPCNGFKEVK